MKSPWKAIQPMRADREYLVLASSIPPRSRSSTQALFAGASAVRRQLADTDGLIGFSLLARRGEDGRPSWRDALQRLG